MYCSTVASHGSLGKLKKKCFKFLREKFFVPSSVLCEKEKYFDGDTISSQGAVFGNRLKWAGYVARMEVQRALKVIFNFKPVWRKNNRRRKAWEDQIMKDLNRIGVRNCRQAAANRTDQKNICSQAMTTKLQSPIEGII